jgi:hypothetical protein
LSWSPAASAIDRTADGHRRQVGRIEHRHQRIAARRQQLGGARLVGGTAGHDQHRAGLDFAAKQDLDRVVRLVAAGADPDVAGIAEQ